MGIVLLLSLARLTKWRLFLGVGATVKCIKPCSARSVRHVRHVRFQKPYLAKKLLNWSNFLAKKSLALEVQVGRDHHQSELPRIQSEFLLICQGQLSCFSRTPNQCLTRAVSEANLQCIDCNTIVAMVKHALKTMAHELVA